MSTSKEKKKEDTELKPDKGSPKPYTINEDDRLSLVEEASIGIQVDSVADLIRLSRLSKDFFADLLNISTKTLARYQVRNQKLNAASSEIMLKLKQTYHKGTEIFGNAEAFRVWVEKPAPGLQMKTPKELLLTSTGIDLVMEELIRIEYGYPV